MLDEFAWDPRYCVSEIEGLLTPALLVFPQVIAANIERTLHLLGGDADRWRVHVKTAKLGYTLRMLLHRGVRNFKCATTLELLEACRSGAADVLLAYPVLGANAARAREIAEQFPQVRVSVLAESEAHVRQWRGTRVSVFLDINPGMNRTGIDQGRGEVAVQLAQAVGNAGVEFGGLHYYDGQYGGLEEGVRTRAAHAGYDRLLDLVHELERNGIGVPEVITAGTPTFPCSLSYERFRSERFRHRVSPGTVVYFDATSLQELPKQYGYAPGVLVLTRVVSRPGTGVVTCDAGHKTVSADAGVPTCVVVGHAEVKALKPSEEHLPMSVTGPGPGPQIGDVLYLLPRHVCPTVNNFDSAVLVCGGQIESVEAVSARGREGPLLRTAGLTGAHAGRSTLNT